MTFKKPALLAEDGAKFVGNIQKLENGQFQATCGAELDVGNETQIEQPEYFTGGSYEEAKTWINAMAAARKFETWLNESEIEDLAANG